MSADAHPASDGRHAWSQLPRQEPTRRAAPDRIADFLEIYGFYDEVAAREQASRCVQCPEPTCVAGCPLGTNIPEWLALTAEGHFAAAAQALQGAGNLPEICARVCPADHLCEAHCVINGQAQPVSIWAVEQFLNEYAFAHGLVQPAVAPPNGHNVAVIGAGPGGLACADGLVRRGYTVTVFDHRPQPGGMLVYATPEFHLQRSIVERRVDLLRRQGVTFRLADSQAEHLPLTLLLEDFDAVYLALGAKQPRTLDAPGHDLDGVHQAVPFLLQAGTDSAAARALVGGKHVAVIGGGDTAIDCARAVVRSGAASVAVVYRRDEASLPAMRRDYEAALEEDVRFLFRALPISFIGRPPGVLTGLQLVRTEAGPLSADGRRWYVPKAEPFSLVVDLAFLALGFDPAPLPAESPWQALARTATGAFQVDSRQMTSLPGVFAGGDLVRGPCTALHAVRDARQAVAGIDAFLAARPDISKPRER